MKIRPQEALRKVLYVAVVSGLAALTAGVDANEPTGYWNCDTWSCGGNSPIVEGTAIVAPGSQPRPARRHERRADADQSVGVDENNATAHRPAPKAQVPKHKATETGLNRALLDSRFGEAGWFPRCCPAPEPMASGCRLWGCGYNSPVVEGAAIVTPASHARPARRHNARQLSSKTVVVDDVDTHTLQAPISKLRPSTRGKSALRSSMREARFGEAMALACAQYTCDSNSPVVEGAAIVTPASHARPARRHQVAQLANKDVMLGVGSAVAGSTLVMDSSNLQSAVRDARFGEADTNTASSLKNGQQVPPSQSKILVMPLQEQRFGETWGKNLNSPVIEGAAMDARIAPRARQPIRSAEE